jgi:hypothetical protein
MARIPCAFSVQEEFLRQIDERAAQLGMKRSEFILQALRKELQNRGPTMSIVAETPDSWSPPKKDPPAGYKIPRAAKTPK